jgi:hypothetical protein
MSISTFNTSGCTQNVFCASGKGQMPIPVPSAMPTVSPTSGVAITLLPSQSGTLFLLAGSGAAITLPTPTSAGTGCWFKFQMTTVYATSSWVVTSTGNVYGSLINNAAGTLGGIVKSAANSATFSTGGVIGDQMTCTCDGAKWSITGYGGNTASFA